MQDSIACQSKQPMVPRQEKPKVANPGIDMWLVGLVFYLDVREGVGQLMPYKVTVD